MQQKLASTSTSEISKLPQNTCHQRFVAAILFLDIGIITKPEKGGKINVIDACVTIKSRYISCYAINLLLRIQNFSESNFSFGLFMIVVHTLLQDLRIKYSSH